jgi:hypothetical protein
MGEQYAILETKLSTTDNTIQLSSAHYYQLIFSHKKVTLTSYVLLSYIYYVAFV